MNDSIDYPRSDLLAETSWVAAHGQDNGVRLVDCAAVYASSRALRALVPAYIAHATHLSLDDEHLMLDDEHPEDEPLPGATCVAWSLLCRHACALQRVVVTCAVPSSSTLTCPTC